MLDDAELICTSARSGCWAQEIRAYPDGLPLMSEPATEPSAMLLRPASINSFYAALFWVDALAARGLTVPHLVLPCVPGARQDRLNDSGDYLFTARSIAAAINARGFPSVTILDPHSDVTPALIDRCKVVRAFTTADDTLWATPYDGVIAPDGGALRRAFAFAQDLGVPLFHAWKSRNIETGALAGFGLEPVPAGHYLVVDDLCDGGGTFIGLKEAAPPALTMDLYVTHGLFTRGTELLRSRYRAIYTTDSTLGAKPGVIVLPRCEKLFEQAGRA